MDTFWQILININKLINLKKLWKLLFIHNLTFSCHYVIKFSENFIVSPYFTLDLNKIYFFFYVFPINPLNSYTAGGISDGHGSIDARIIAVS